MMRDDGQIKLMDFGIARFLDESQVTLTGALVGSPAFMSPEQAREDGLDTRSDLFSLGTLLFYLVTGHLPFSGSNASVILKNIIEGNRPHITELAPSMSASLADVVEQLLSVHREDRQNSARQVYEQLLACHARSASITPTPSDPSRYLDEPAAYSEDPLVRVAARGGRGLMAAGEQLSALRLFNRFSRWTRTTKKPCPSSRTSMACRRQRTATEWCGSHPRRCWPWAPSASCGLSGTSRPPGTTHPNHCSKRPWLSRRGFLR